MKKIMLVMVVGSLFLAAVFSAGQKDAAGTTNWPTKSINLVVAFGAGGSADYNARSIAKYLSKELGQPVVVTNIAGSGGSIGSNQVKNSTPDGYTVLINQLSLNMAQISGVADFGYADFEEVCVFSRSADEVLVVRADSSWNTFDDMIADTKKNPGKYKITANTGASTQWISIALQNAGAKFNIVSSGGSGERITLLLGGHVDVIPMPWNMVEDYVKTGQFKVLANVSPVRSTSLPDVPTLREKGVDCSYYYNFTMFMPKGTNSEIVNKLAKACEKIITTNKEYQAELVGFAQQPAYMGPAEATAHYKKEYEELFVIQDQIRGKK